MPYASVGVPPTDQSDLDSLIETIGDEATPVETAHPFDGMVILQTVLPLTAATVAVLRAWINARRDARKEYRIVADGIEISGYSAKEAERVMLALMRDREEDREATPGLDDD